MQGLELTDILRSFRALEDNNDAIPILGDDDAMRVLAAWRKTDQAWSKPKRKMPVLKAGNHAAVWAWVRSGWVIDVDAIARAAGVSKRVAHAKVDMLVAARLIYPDGQIAMGAQTALQLHVAQKLGIKPKRNDDKKRPGKTPDTGDNSN